MLELLDNRRADSLHDHESNFHALEEGKRLRFNQEIAQTTVKAVPSRRKRRGKYAIG
jgi:hypothetical protein